MALVQGPYQYGMLHHQYINTKANTGIVQSSISTKDVSNMTSDSRESNDTTLNEQESKMPLLKVFSRIYNISISEPLEE